MLQTNYFDPESEEEIPTQEAAKRMEEEKKAAKKTYEFVKTVKAGMHVEFENEEGEWVGATITRPSSGEPGMWWVKMDSGSRDKKLFEKKKWRTVVS